MKELNLYWIGVNIRGPHSHSKSGAGAWLVCETSEKNAKKALQDYFNENHLIGSSDDICRSSTIPDLSIVSRGTCMRQSEYYALVEENKEKEKNKYQFSPKISEKGIQLHKYTKNSSEYEEPNIHGAFGNNIDKELTIDDCGELPDIEGVTYNGESLTHQNLDSLIDEITEELEAE